MTGIAFLSWIVYRYLHDACQVINDLLFDTHYYAFIIIKHVVNFSLQSEALDEEDGLNNNEEGGEEANGILE